MFVVVPSSDYAHPIDLRRSGRLQLTGYNKRDLVPLISYKETPYKVFNKRKRQPSRRPEQQLEVENILVHDASQVTPRRRSNTWWMFVRKHILMLCVCLLAGTMMMMTAGHLYHKADQDSYSRLLYTEGKQGPNYASMEHGAKVIISQTSSTCRIPTWRELVKSWLKPKQDLILQCCSPLRPGVCWPMAGDKGFVTIQLSQGIRVRHVTIGHIRKYQAPTKDTPSAPRDMALYGLKWDNSEELFLGSFTYDQNGPSFQTFSLKHTDPEIVRHVRLHINSNYGNEDFTCLYNVRVHGQI